MPNESSVLQSDIKMVVNQVLSLFALYVKRA